MFGVFLHRLLLFSFVGVFCFVFAVRDIALPSFPVPLVATGKYVHMCIPESACECMQLEVTNSRAPFRESSRGGESERGRYTTSLGEAPPLHSLHFGFIF